MKQYTHISVGLCIGLMLLSLVNIVEQMGFLYLFFIFFFIIVAKANDWLDFFINSDHKRLFLTHSPLSPLLIIISILIGIVFGSLGMFLGISIALITHMIFFSHFALDVLNPSGVRLLPKKKICLNSIPYDNFKWNALLFLSGILMSCLGIFNYSVFS